MSKIRSIIGLAATLTAFGLAASPAQAQGSPRTFVSSTGTDSGGCGLAAPCRTFAYALTQTAAHGEIDVLDTAGYGAMTITQSVSIVNPGGVEAGIAASNGGTAIAIAAGPNDVVALRGLTVEGLQSGATGISLTSAGALEIDNCVVRDFTGDAIDITPSGATQFRISNSVVEDNAHRGVYVLPSGSGTAQGVIDHVAASGNPKGIAINGGGGATVNVSITNSVASGSSQDGIIAGSGAVVSIGNTTASVNAVGLLAGASGVIQLTQSLVTGNTIGVSLSGGTVDSYQDNQIGLNGTDVSGGSLTPVSQK